MKSDHIKRLITLTCEYIQRLSLHYLPTAPESNQIMLSQIIEHDNQCQTYNFILKQIVLNQTEKLI